MAKAWGGRFQKETAPLMDDFHSSIHFDYRLAMEVIARGTVKDLVSLPAIPALQAGHLPTSYCS